MKIDSKIVGYSVSSPDCTPESVDDQALSVVHMSEEVTRPPKLDSSTYKIKLPESVSVHALYVTIGDVVLNEGTEHEMRQPYEIFINCKALEHYQWIVALTLVMSSVFRKGGDVTFLVEGLESVFDPRGGYWNKGKYVPSMIAEIGCVIKDHFISIGLIDTPGLDEHQVIMIEEKNASLSAE